MLRCCSASPITPGRVLDEADQFNQLLGLNKPYRLQAQLCRKVRVIAGICAYLGRHRKIQRHPSGDLDGAGLAGRKRSEFRKERDSPVRGRPVLELGLFETLVDRVKAHRIAKIVLCFGVNGRPCIARPPAILDRSTGPIRLAVIIDVR